MPRCAPRWRRWAASQNPSGPVTFPAPPAGHLLVAPGDVLLTLDPAAAASGGAGVTGFALPEPLVE